MLAISHILVPVDFETPSAAATDMAVDLAEKLDARITLVHAYEVSLYVYSGAPFMPVMDTTAAIEDAAKEAMTKLVAEVEKRHAKTTGVVRAGYAWQEILAAIDETKPDLVIMGTHGRHGLPHAILGSVAERVVRLSPVPVLTVHTPGKP